MMAKTDGNRRDRGRRESSKTLRLFGLSVLTIYVF